MIINASELSEISCLYFVCMCVLHRYLKDGSNPGDVEIDKEISLLEIKIHHLGNSHNLVVYELCYKLICTAIDDLQCVVIIITIRLSFYCLIRGNL